MRSAATNVHAVTIVVQANGSASIDDTTDGATSSGTVPAATAAQFFSDLNANTPVVDIKTYGPCTKSSSFGTSTTVMFEGYTTGDVSCPSGSASPTPSDMVFTDIENIEQSLGVTETSP